MADTGHLGALASGAHVNLLCSAWRSPTCSLPDDDKMLSRMSRCNPREWAKVRSTVLALWTLDGASKMWFQKRQVKERERVREKVAKAKHAAEAKWLKQNKTGDAGASSEHMQNNGPSIRMAPAPTMPTITITKAIKDSSALSAPTFSANPAAVEIVRAFDAEIVAAYGEAQARPWPNSLDLPEATRWVEAGVPLDLCRSVFAATLQRRKASGAQPIGNLMYFSQAIADAVAQSQKPMPEGHANASGTRDRPRKSTGFDNAVAAARSLLAGESFYR